MRTAVRTQHLVVIGNGCGGRPRCGGHPRPWWSTSLRDHDVRRRAARQRQPRHLVARRRPRGGLETVDDCPALMIVTTGIRPCVDRASVLADHVTGHDRHAAYHGSNLLVIRLKVAGFERAVTRIDEPERPSDELVKVAEPQRCPVQDARRPWSDPGRGGAARELDTCAALTRACDRATPWPADPLSLLFDLASPPAGSSVAGMADDLQVCSCNGVSKGAIRACAATGGHSVKRSVSSVFAAPAGGVEDPWHAEARVPKTSHQCSTEIGVPA